MKALVLPAVAALVFVASGAAFAQMDHSMHGTAMVKPVTATAATPKADAPKAADASKKGNTPLFVHTGSLRGGFMHIRRGVVFWVLRCLLGFDFEPKMRLTLDDFEAKPLLFP